MSSTDPTGKDWADQEIDLIVADYFAMLWKELAGEHYVKAHHNAELQKITGRSHRSIEFKNMNISAVLQKLGRPWIVGYRPMMNFQNTLIDGVERFLTTNHDIISIGEPNATGFAEQGPIFMGPTPAMDDRDENDPPALRRLVRKFDPAARDERNRALGQRGEERVFFSERARLQSIGREDLAQKIRWVSQEEGDGAGYDILSFSERGKERFLEVKTTTGHLRTPFYLSANERAFSEERPDEFRIFRLYDFARDPKAFTISPPLENTLILRPANYRASFS